MESRGHALCIPAPSQGHINAMLMVAKLLYSKGFRITFLHIEANYRRVAADRDGSLDRFRFETVATEMRIGSNVDMHGHFASPTRDLIGRLRGEGHPPTCIISDVFMSYTLELSAELGVPNVLLCPVSACSFMGFFQYKALIESGVVPMKSQSYRSDGYLDTVIDWIPGMKNICLRDLPSFVRTTDPNDPFLQHCKREAQAALRATAVIMHTFEELERPVLDALSSILPPVYPIGPLSLLVSQIPDDELKSVGSSLWKEDSACTDWLDGRGRGSVVYVNFGSVVTVTGEQLEEFAWGIASSGHDFLWVIRPEILEGAGGALPAEFVEETGGRGLVASWCVQEEVIRHPAVGGFLTHCGWNSTMEAIGAGVPLICWPIFADQPTTCRYLCSEWGLGLEIDEEVKRADVEEKVREVMGEEKGKELRKNAAKWKESAYRATETGGNSSLHLERLLKEVMFT